MARLATWHRSKCADSRADHRTDIFAVGVVLYEMLSGRRAFGGDTAMDVTTAILKEDPSDLPADQKIPPALQRIVDRCLATPRTSVRFQSASDLAFALETLSTQSGAAATIIDPLGRRWIVTGKRIAWTAGLVATAVVSGFGIFFIATPRVESPAAAIRFQVPLPTGTALHDPVQPSLSPDGRHVAFAVNILGRGISVLALRSIQRASVTRPGLDVFSEPASVCDSGHCSGCSVGHGWAAGR